MPQGLSLMTRGQRVIGRCLALPICNGGGPYSRRQKFKGGVGLAGL
jgi:hypothetical protein